MSIKSVLNQFKLSDDIVARLGNVLNSATEHNDVGVIDWVYVSMSYAVNGKLRPRDMNTLHNLEDTYNRVYYGNRLYVERDGACLCIA